MEDNPIPKIVWMQALISSLFRQMWISDGQFRCFELPVTASVIGASIMYMHVNGIKMQNQFFSKSHLSPQLNSYLSRIDPSAQDICDKCGSAGHITTHLFSCPANPTTLTTEDLWRKPVEVAQFLGLQQADTWTPPILGYKQQRCNSRYLFRQLPSYLQTNIQCSKSVKETIQIMQLGHYWDLKG